METRIAAAVARTYAGKDWHRLSNEEQEVIALLEQSGYLTKNNPPNGFVGKAVQKTG